MTLKIIITYRYRYLEEITIFVANYYNDHTEKIKLFGCPSYYVK